MRYIDKYKDCVGCPVKKYCGTMVGSIRLCNSYESSQDSKSFMSVSSKELDEYAEEQIRLSLEIM